jgi:DNA-directed RNA polymerase specialized sigma24 family protein
MPRCRCRAFQGHRRQGTGGHIVSDNPADADTLTRKSRDELIVAHIGLATALALRYRPQADAAQLDIDDVVGTALLGLAYAGARYRPELGPFSAWVRLIVHQHLNRLMKTTAGRGLIHLPRTLSHEERGYAWKTLRGQGVTDDMPERTVSDPLLILIEREERDN